MPTHDWRDSIPDIFHDFHQSWVVRISDVLNTGTLPRGYYALLEPVAAGFHRTVLTGADFDRIEASLSEPGLSDIERYARRADRVGIYHASSDQVIGWIDVLSPGDKQTATACSAHGRREVGPRPDRRLATSKRRRHVPRCCIVFPMHSRTGVICW